MQRRILLFAFLAAACGHTASLDRAKVGGSTDTDVTVGEVPVRGADTRVYLTNGDNLDGELLAVGNHAIALRREGEDLIIAATDIEKIRVTAYSNAALTGALITWTAVGTTATLSHGVFLIFSAPIWAVTGTGTSVAAAEDSDQSAIVYGGEQAQLWQFARFPQGLPPGYPIKGNPPPVPVPVPEASTDAGTGSD
jgi:sRNA-binding regulator protein Hfq